MKNKKGILAVTVLLMLLTAFFGSAPVSAGTQGIYDELAGQFPEYISKLVEKGASEAQIRAFVDDIYAGLKGGHWDNESDFKDALLGAALQAARQEEHSVVVNALFQAYESDIPKILEGKVPSGFQPLYDVLKEKLLGSSAPPAPAGTGGVLPAPKPVADITVSVDGGTFTNADGQALLVIPEGALTGEGTLKIAVAEITEEMSGTALHFASKVYEFTASVSSFAIPVTVSFKYDPTAVTDPGLLGIYCWNETRKSWIYLGGNIDRAGSSVSVTVSRFTKFALLADPARVKLTDIGTHWAYGSIDRLVGMGITSGYEDGTFRPDQTISRAEFARIIAKALDLELDSQAALTFSDAADVPEWARPAVAAAVSAGIISGYDDNTFKPGRLINRAELATMMVRAMDLGPAAAPALAFSDAGEIPQWARGYVAAAAEKGIIKGRDGNIFDALANATRAEAAVMVIRMLEALGI